jgi:hypothetical protein
VPKRDETISGELNVLTSVAEQSLDGCEWQQPRVREDGISVDGRAGDGLRGQRQGTVDDA